MYNLHIIFSEDGDIFQLLQECNLYYLCNTGEFATKGSEDVVSAVCYTIYTIYLSLCTQTTETTSPEPHI